MEYVVKKKPSLLVALLNAVVPQDGAVAPLDDATMPT